MTTLRTDRRKFLRAMNLLSLWQKSQPPPLMAVHLNLAGEHTPNHTHTHLSHGTNILLVPCGYYIPRLSTFKKCLQLPEKKTCRRAQQKAGTQLTSVSSISSLPIAAGKAGNIRHCLHAWGAIMSNLRILAMIEFGFTLDFIGLPQVFPPQ